jgi:hypothetical protein
MSRKAKIAVRRGTTLLESDRRRRLEFHVAPPKQAERQHAKPGSGIKRSRGAMLPKGSRKSSNRRPAR